MEFPSESELREQALEDATLDELDELEVAFLKYSLLLGFL